MSCSVPGCVIVHRFLDVYIARPYSALQQLSISRTIRQKNEQDWSTGSGLFCSILCASKRRHWILSRISERDQSSAEEKDDADEQKILIVAGSPRKGGNSDLLCDQFLRGAGDAGHHAEKIYVTDKQINFSTVPWRLIPTKVRQPGQ